MKSYSPVKNCIKASLNKTKPLCILFAVYGAFCLVIGILLSLSVSVPSFFGCNMFASSISQALKISNLLSVAAALVCVVMLFSKYKNPCSNNAVRALPASDKNFFIADFSVGLFIFAIPCSISLLFQTIADFILTSGIENNVGTSAEMVLNYVFSYCLAVLCFCIAKETFESIILFVVLSFIPSITESFVNFAKSSVLGLFEVDEYSNSLQIKTAYSVVYNAVCGKSESPSVLQAIIVGTVLIFLSAAITAAAAFLFVRLRKDSKTSAKTKSIISTASLVAVSFYCGFLILYFKRLGITLFNAVMVTSTMVLTSFIVFYLTNTIAEKSLKVPLKSFKPFIINLVLIAVIGLVYFSGGFGSAVYLPDVSEIESVTVNYADDEYKEQVQQQLNARFTDTKFLATFDLDVKFPITYSDFKSKVAITKYHQALLSEYKEHNLLETYLQRDEHFDEKNPRTVITYKLKNGKTVTRRYNYNGKGATLENLARLELYDNSVKEIGARADKYIKKEPQKTIRTLMVSPIVSDLLFNRTDIADKELQQLVAAIQTDEKLLNDNDILNCESGDFCTIAIIPNGNDEEYFSGIFKTTKKEFVFTVKACYTNTIAFLKSLEGFNTLNEGYPASSVKQIVVGDNYSGIFAMWNPGIFRYSHTTTYFYSYLGCERFYNKAAMLNTEYPLIDGKQCNTAALEFLFSKLKLYCNTQNGGKFLMINQNLSISDSEEPEEAVGKKIYYVSPDDWLAFLAMCN